MRKASLICRMAVGLSLVMLNHGCGQPTHTEGDSNGQQAAQKAGTEKGIQDAERDRDKGILKMKEYPPLPYSLTDIKYIKLLKERCGVEHEVLGPGNDKELRAEAQAYNNIMSAAIRKKFGNDILSQLREEASKR